MKLHRNVCVAQLGLPPAEILLDVSMDDNVDTEVHDAGDVTMTDASGVEDEGERMSGNPSEELTQAPPKAWRGGFIPQNQEIVTNPFKCMEVIREPRKDEPKVVMVTRAWEKLMVYTLRHENRAKKLNRLSFVRNTEHVQLLKALALAQERFFEAELPRLWNGEDSTQATFMSQEMDLLYDTDEEETERHLSQSEMIANIANSLFGTQRQNRRLDGQN